MRRVLAPGPAGPAPPPHRDCPHGTPRQPSPRGLRFAPEAKPPGRSGSRRASCYRHLNPLDRVPLVVVDPLRLPLLGLPLAFVIGGPNRQCVGTRAPDDPVKRPVDPGVWLGIGG